jgi:hypothetical protein
MKPFFLLLFVVLVATLQLMEFTRNNTGYGVMLFKDPGSAYYLGSTGTCTSSYSHSNVESRLMYGSLPEC